MLPCVLLTLNFFFRCLAAYLHATVPLSFSPSFSSQPGPKFVLGGHTAGSPRTPWEKCRSAAVQCEGLFGYQTSSSNLHGVKLNIAVSCRLPHGPERAQERKGKKRALQYSSHAFKSVIFSGRTWSYCCQKDLWTADLWVGKGSLSKLPHVRVLPFCLQISSFSRSQDMSGGCFWTRRRERRQDFPCIDLFVTGPPQIDFPSWYIIGA